MAPVGISYSFDGGGEIIWDPHSTYQYATTYYFYDMAGNMIKSVDPEGKQTIYSYNSIGQLVSETHPDKGTKNYRYDRYGRLRFTMDQKDINNFSTNVYVACLNYNKYDKWNRVVESGKIKIPMIGSIDIFDNEVNINNSYAYPVYNNHGDYAELHKRLTYEGSYADNAKGRLIKEEVFSNHYFDAFVNDYVPSNTDMYEYKYTKDGLLCEKKYTLNGLSNAHTMVFSYNIAGLHTEVSYKNATNTAYNFSEFYNYDRLGRLLQSGSGKSLLYKTNDTKYNYDGLGKLKSKYLAQKSPASSLDPYQEYISYSYDIKDQMVSEVSKNFKSLFTFDNRKNITEQVWNNTKLDNLNYHQAGVPYLQHKYRYFYDAMNRQVGANYIKLFSDNDPYYAYVPHDITTCTERGDCYWISILHHNDIYMMYEKIKNHNIEVINNMSDKSALEWVSGDNDNTLPMDYINKVEAIINVDYDFINGANLANDPTENFEKIGRMATSAMTDLTNAFKVRNMVKEITCSETDDETKINSLIGEFQTLELSEVTQETGVYTRNTGVEMINSIVDILTNTGLSASQKLGLLNDYMETELAYTDWAWDLASDYWGYWYTLKQVCIIEGECTSLRRWDAVLVNPTLSPPNRVYDCEYYYDKSGNFSTLNRFDDLPVRTKQNYSYNTGTNVVLNVGFTVGSNPAISSAYTHDATGNQVSDSKSGISLTTYNDYHNMPMSFGFSNGTTMSFRYDAADQRIYKIGPTGSAEYELGFVVLDNTGKPIRYSLKEGYAELNMSNNIERKFVIRDWQGTTRLVINGNNGNIVSSRDHYPYGKLMPQRVFESDVEGKRYQFTGHTFDEESQFEYHGARYYNRELGRYLAVDPLSPKFPEWSAYHYAGNNPVHFIDPTGMGKESTHLDKENNVIAIYNDGDLGVYKHEDLSGWDPENMSLAKFGKGVSYVGRPTKFWNEFLNAEECMNGVEIPEGRLILNTSWNSVINRTHQMAMNYDLLQIAQLSLNFKLFDIKTNLKIAPYGIMTGRLLDGYYASARSAGNYTAGWNGYEGTYLGAGLTWHQYINIAGSLQVGQYHGKNTYLDILSGTTFGPAPYFGEMEYSGRYIRFGWKEE